MIIPTWGQSALGTGSHRRSGWPDWAGKVEAEPGRFRGAMLNRSTVTDYYDHNFLSVNERRTDHLGPVQSDTPGVVKLWRIRAKQVVLATGAIERPLVFDGNDTGVVLASAVSTYIHRYAVPWPRVQCSEAMVPDLQTAIDMADAGMEVRAVVRQNDGGC